MRQSIQIVLAILLLSLVFTRSATAATDEDYAVKLAATATGAGIALSWSYTQQAYITTSLSPSAGILIRRRAPTALNGVWSTIGAIQGSVAPTTPASPIPRRSPAPLTSTRYGSMSVPSTPTAGPTRGTTSPWSRTAGRWCCSWMPAWWRAWPRA